MHPWQLCCPAWNELSAILCWFGLLPGVVGLTGYIQLVRTMRLVASRYYFPDFKTWSFEKAWVRGWGKRNRLFGFHFVCVHFTLSCVKQIWKLLSLHIEWTLLAIRWNTNNMFEKPNESFQIETQSELNTISISYDTHSWIL